jgi:homospermidine synthase
MTDYIVKYKYYIDDLEFDSEKVLTIEDDIHIKSNRKYEYQDIEFETEQITRDLLLELLKEELREWVELISFEPVIDNNFDIYKLTY